MPQSTQPSQIETATALKPLRIALLGTGSLGTLMAWHWRHQSLSVIRRDYSRPLLLHHKVTDQLDLPAWQGTETDWLVVLTKAADTLNALQSLRPKLPAVKRLLLLQNGMGQQEDVARWLANENLSCELWVGTSTEGAFTDEQGVVHYAGRGQTWAGRWHIKDDQRAARESAALPPGVLHDPDILQRLQAKLAINACINPLTALYRCRNGELLSNADYQRHFDALCAEVQMLTDTLGWQLPFSVQAQAAEIAAATADNRSSTLQDILRQKPTELPYISGYLLTLAQTAGVATPVSQNVMDRLRSGADTEC